MGMLRLSRVGARHEAWNGNKFVGEIDDDHLRDYVARLPPRDQSRQYSTNAARVLLSIDPSDRYRNRKALAAAVAERRRDLVFRHRDMSPGEITRLATREVLHERPYLLGAYRAESAPLQGVI